jgi:predicted homoserine dehydrogenase-like protein
MNLHQMGLARLENEGPVRVGLIGAGKFGSMFLAQVPTSPHIQVVAIADLDVDKAKAACCSVGWDDAQILQTRFTDESLSLAGDPQVEVIVEATGHPAAGIAHARAAIQHGKHIVMVNVEADVLAGPALAADARSAGIVYSMAYGDQPALVCEMVDWARACGFEVVAAGKGTKYQPHYHSLTPDDVWANFGIDPQEAAAGGMNPQMFNSFMDGTKSAIEMAAIANATGLDVPENGLLFPPSSCDELTTHLRPVSEGGQLAQKGMVEVVSSMRRGANEEMDGHLRWGVYTVFEAPNDYTQACFHQYGLHTDKSGRYGSLYRPYHLIGLELNISILSAALRGEPTGATREWRGDVVAVAKRNLRTGDILDGEGGYCAWGKLVPAKWSLERGALPIGLAHGIAMKSNVAAGEIITYADVKINAADPATIFRQEMERNIYQA